MKNYVLRHQGLVHMSENYLGLIHDQGRLFVCLTNKQCVPMHRCPADDTGKGLPAGIVYNLILCYRCDYKVLMFSISIWQHIVYNTTSNEMVCNGEETVCLTEKPEPI